MNLSAQNEEKSLGVSN